MVITQPKGSFYMEYEPGHYYRVKYALVNTTQCKTHPFGCVFALVATPLDEKLLCKAENYMIVDIEGDDEL